MGEDDKPGYMNNVGAGRGLPTRVRHMADLIIVQSSVMTVDKEGDCWQLADLIIVRVQSSVLTANKTDGYWSGGYDDNKLSLRWYLLVVLLLSIGITITAFRVLIFLSLL